MTQRSIRILLTTGAAALALLIFLAPKTKIPVTSGDKLPVSDEFSGLMEEYKAVLPFEARERILSFEKQSQDKENYTDSLAAFYDSLKIPAMAAMYYEKIASKNPSEKNYLNAAYRYFDGFHESSDAASKELLIGKAKAMYEQVLKINPKNLDAKTDLGVCYAEAGAEPMKGIMMLREVVTENPAHENAHFNLGVLSVRSNQTEKAIERFKKVIELNPKRSDAYIYLAETLVQKGEKEKAKNVFQKLIENSNDTSLIRLVQEQIKKIE